MPKYLDNALSALKGFVHNFAKTSRHLLKKQEPGVNNFEKTSQCQKIGLLRTVNYVMKSYRCYDKSDVNTYNCSCFTFVTVQNHTFAEFPEVCDQKFIDYHALMT